MALFPPAAINCQKLHKWEWMMDYLYCHSLKIFMKNNFDHKNQWPFIKGKVYIRRFKANSKFSFGYYILYVLLKLTFACSCSRGALISMYQICKCGEFWGIFHTILGAYSLVSVITSESHCMQLQSIIYFNFTTNIFKVEWFLLLEVKL